MKSFDHISYPKAYIRIRPSKIIKGQVGAFALRPFQQDEVIVRAIDFEDDNLMDVAEYHKLDPDTKSLVFAHSTITPTFLYIPANINHIKPINFFNHSCNPNVGFDRLDNYVAMKTIPKGTEFLLDYSFLNTNPEYEMKCSCGSKKCRGIITGNEWRNGDFVRRFNKYFASTIRVLLQKDETCSAPIGDRKRDRILRRITGHV